MSRVRFSVVSNPHFTSAPPLSGGWIVAAIAATALVDVLLLLSAGLHIGLSRATFGLVFGGMAAALTCYALRRPVTRAQRLVRDMVEGVGLFATVSLLGAIGSYPLAAGRHGLVDPELERIDLDLHFRWVDWYALVVRHAWIQPIERTAYLSIFVTPALLIAYFVWTGRKSEGRRFLATFWVTAVLTLALFPLMPAAGPLSTLWRGAIPYMPLSALYQDQVIVGLRDHLIRSVDLGDLHGLVCAPSFHAASAVVFMATAWRHALLRWPVTLLNVAMLLATPVEGTHYLTDVLSGAGVAGLGLWLAPILIRATQRVDAAVAATASAAGGISTAGRRPARPSPRS